MNPFQKEGIWIGIFFALLALAFIAPVAQTDFVRDAADYINHLMMILQTDLAFHEGQFPLRTAPLEAAGFGYPFFQFYSPSAYTLAGGLFHFFANGNPLIAFKETAWLGLFVGGIYFYRLSFSLIGSRIAAILSSVAYLSSPYFLIVLGHFGDLTETLSLSILPPVLFYAWKRFLATKPYTEMWKSSLAWYLLISFHIVTFVQTVFLLSLLLFCICLRNRSLWRNASQVLLSLGVAALMSAWYWVPIALLNPYLVISNTFDSQLHFQQYADLLPDLLFSGAAISSHFQSGLQSLHPSLGWPILFGFILSLHAYYRPKPSEIAWKNTLLALLSLFSLSFFLAWSPWNIWIYLPKILASGQYAWRYLSQVIWIGSLLLGFASLHLFQNALDRRHLVLGIFLIVLINSAWFSPFDRNKADLDRVKLNSRLIYGNDAFLIDFEKHTEVVEAIDNLRLYTFMKAGFLEWQQRYILPKALLDLDPSPMIHFQGNLLHPKAGKIAFLVNGKILETQDTSKSPLDWQISLKSLEQTFPAAQKFTLQFMFIPKDASLSPPEIQMRDIILMGFLTKENKIDLSEALKLCVKEKTSTVCKFNLKNPNTKIELPILYYPDLLHIEINGKSAPYHSLVYTSQLITSVQATAGLNEIRIRFDGITWANRLSLLAWLLWLSFLFL